MYNQQAKASKKFCANLKKVKNRERLAATNKAKRNGCVFQIFFLNTKYLFINLLLQVNHQLHLCLSYLQLHQFKRKKFLKTVLFKQ